jgi:competence protein ComEA
VASIEAPINLNTADAATLTLLNGVGDKKAADIVAYRQARGKFSRVEDLLNVKGIGEKTLEKNRDRLIVN